MKLRTSFAGFAALTGALVLAACNSSEPAKPATSTPAPASTPPAAAASATPRVFFVEPAADASVKSPVHFKFGSEGVTISPVPPDPITTVRPGMGHYHLGIDVDCLAPGTESSRAPQPGSTSEKATIRSTRNSHRDRTRSRCRSQTTNTSPCPGCARR